MRVTLLLLFFFLFQCSPISRSSLEKPKLKNGFEYYAASIDSLNNEAYTAALELANEAIRLNPNYAKFYLLQGDIFAQLEKTDEALKAYNHATKLRSSFVEAYLSIAKIYEKKKKNYDEAIKYYRRAYASDESNLGLLLNISECYYAKNEINLAKNKTEEYRNLLESQKKSPGFDFYYLYGRIHYQLHEIDQAKNFFQQALEHQPKNFDAKLMLVRCLFKLDEIELGIKHTNELLNIKDDVGEIFYFRGLYYFKKDKFNDALDLFKRALSMDDTLLKSHYYLGKIYEHVGEKEKSLEHLQQYRKTMENEEHIIDLP